MVVIGIGIAFPVYIQISWIRGKKKERITGEEIDVYLTKSKAWWS
jgi:hypothetical protein